MMIDEKKVIDYLSRNIGEYTTSYLLVRDAGAYQGDMKKLDHDELLEMEDKVMKIAEANGFTLNKDHHDFKLEGLPWNLDFKILR